jgi:hypothetical protein
MHLAIFILLNVKEKFDLDVGNFAILLFFILYLAFVLFLQGCRHGPKLQLLFAGGHFQLNGENF